MNFIRLVTGDVDAADLIVRGELKITGDLQRAARLPSYFRPEAAAKSEHSQRRKTSSSVILTLFSFGMNCLEFALPAHRQYKRPEV